MAVRNETTDKPAAAPVNHVIPISVVDGPGARAAVFLQGCNIHCTYCHNPETQRLCDHCGDCVPGCPAGALTLENGRVAWNEARCIGCDSCIRACRSFSTPKVNWMTAAETFQQIRPNLPFIRGITVSGGECTLYPSYLTELFTIARQYELTCLIDSNGMVPFTRLDSLMAVTDGVLLDLKAWDQGVFQALTGAPDNTVVKENISYLSKRDKLSELRIVYLPGGVDALVAINGAAALLGARVAQTRLKLIAFRNIGVIGACANADSPSLSEMIRLKNAAASAGFREMLIV